MRTWKRFTASVTAIARNRLRRPPARAGRRRRRLISPITKRILAVNITALAILAAGTLYLADYRRDLVAAGLAALTTEAEGLAATLAQTATAEDPAGLPTVRADIAQTTTRRMFEASDMRARVLSANAELVADSRRLGGPDGSVRIDPLPPPPPAGASGLGALLDAFDGIVRALAHERIEPLPQPGELPPSVTAALAGETVATVWSREGDVPELGVALPIPRLGEVAGALLLTRPAHDIENAVLAARLGVLQLFVATLVVTVVVSLYLAGTIARPLSRLAAAAEKVRRDLSLTDAIPDYSNRPDEIGDLAIVLREMTEALRLRMDAIESFAADVAHEIKNPLGSIRSAVETAGRVSDPDRLRTLLAIIDDDVKRLDRLIGDISDSSRLDAEMSRIHFERFDLSLMLTTLAELRKDAAAARGVRIAVEGAGRPIRLSGVESRIMQVFDNLLANALSFSPDGGTVTIRPKVAGNRVRILVEDEGPGVPEDQEEKIFKRFYSSRPGAAPAVSHSGLGLSICRQIVEAHGGTVHVEPNSRGGGPPRGSHFVVDLPRNG